MSPDPVHSHAPKATSAGVKHFIPKTYTAETLLTTLRDALRGEH